MQEASAGTSLVNRRATHTAWSSAMSNRTKRGAPARPSFSIDEQVWSSRAVHVVMAMAGSRARWDRDTTRWRWRRARAACWAWAACALTACSSAHSVAETAPAATVVFTEVQSCVAACELVRGDRELRFCEPLAYRLDKALQDRVERTKAGYGALCGFE